MTLTQENLAELHALAEKAKAALDTCYKHPT